MDTAVYFEKVVAGFSRYHKYTLGADLRNKSREIVTLIAKADSSSDKVPRLCELRWNLEDLMVLARICQEIKAFKSFKAFQFAMEVVISDLPTVSSLPEEQEKHH